MFIIGEDISQRVLEFVHVSTIWSGETGVDDRGTCLEMVGKGLELVLAESKGLAGGGCGWVVSKQWHWSRRGRCELRTEVFLLLRG